jgi:hypothetical protein
MAVLISRWEAVAAPVRPWLVLPLQGFDSAPVEVLRISPF